MARHLATRLGEREKAVGKALKARLLIVLCQPVIQIEEGEGRDLFSPETRANWPGIREIRNLYSLRIAFRVDNMNFQGHAGRELFAKLGEPVKEIEHGRFE